jgi:hypothetical protein
MFDDFDENDIELEGLEEAILEKDILNLRNTWAKFLHLFGNNVLPMKLTVT